MLAIACITISFVFILQLAGSDYTATVNQALIFTSEPPQRQCVAIGILDDQLIEDLEQFNIRVDQTLPQGVVSNVASVFITDGKN